MCAGVGGGGGGVRVSLPRRLLTPAVLLLAAATFGGVFAVAQAQEAEGAISGLTLSSDAPGTMSVSWDTPSPAPTGYRLRWAPADSDYLLWNDDNETDRGNAYPAGDATSLTLSGLSGDAEFKVQVRARYNDGGDAHSPWSGPWSGEMTQRVKVEGDGASDANSETPAALPNPTEDAAVESDAASKSDAVAKSDSDATCPGADTAPTPTVVPVTAVPIVVDSTTDDYFVLYVSHELDADTTLEIPVAVTRGEAGSTTLSENVKALPAERYKVEKYLIASPADVDGDCTDDLSDPNPVNPAPPIATDKATISLPDLDAVKSVSIDSPRLFSKFVIFGLDTNRPSIYFMNTNNYRGHQDFLDAVGMEFGPSSMALGNLSYSASIAAPDESAGLYYMSLNRVRPFKPTALVYTMVAASMGALNDNLAVHISNFNLYRFQSDLPAYRASRINIVFDSDIEDESNFRAYNATESYGLLRVIGDDDHPGPRDIAIFETLPNELPRVAGIISTVQQTPLSHVNLRAAQDGIPNAYIRDAREDSAIAPLIGSHVLFAVTRDRYTIRAATRAEVDAHFAASRPAKAQTPQRDLTVTNITRLRKISFDDWDAFGVKAANVAVLRTLDFAQGTAPNGFTIPFYFYDEFMKANDLYKEVRDMLADEDFQTDFEVQEDELKKLRKKIRKADSPQWILDALTTMHRTFPEGQSLRYRSSTNNEDLPGFNGAGLYDSNTQHPHETEEDGIDKSLKQVFASLWNFRAFLERDFHRIDHLSAAMGVLVHPNYSDEKVNGVAVSEDTIYGSRNVYYVNSQVGEDLVTNPEAHSIPEEILLPQDGNRESVLTTSNLVKPGELLMTRVQLQQLRRYLGVIHDHFKALYKPGANEPFAMEIEFKITSANQLAIKQARPWVFSGATTLSTDRAGTVALSSTAPRVGTALTATLTDPDGSISIGAWQWARGPSGSSNWTPIGGATSATYVPVADDLGSYLRAVATYDDGQGGGKSARAMSASPVTGAAPPPPIVITGGGGGGGGGGGLTGPSPSVVNFEWTVEHDIETLDGGHDKPTGMWSDGTTLWLLENGDGADDEGVVWVSDSGRERLFAYDLASGERVAERELELAGRNADARGIWSDGHTMWVLDSRADALFAYDLESGELLAEHMQQPHLAHDPRFQTEELRKRNEIALDEIIAIWCRQQAADRAESDLGARGVHAARARPLREVFADPLPQFLAREYLQTVTHPESGTHRLPVAPWRIGDAAIPAPSHSPCFGEHSREILRQELGIDDAGYAEFVALGVTGAIHDD